jgi:hypothetical protein
VLGDTDGLDDSDGLDDGELLGESDGLGDSEALGDSDGLDDGELLGESDGLGDSEALGDSDGLGETEALGDTDGLGDGFTPEAGQVWVRLNLVSVPVIVAVAPSSVQPAGVVIHAFDVAGPPLAKSVGFAADVIVIDPWLPKSAVTDEKSPVLL